MIGSFLRKAQLTGAAGAPPPPPSWTLDFSSGSPWANGTDYTYSSLRTAGTYVDSSGYIAPNAANLLQRSEEFDNAYWTKDGILAFGSGSTANAATAPDNTTTADLCTESSVNAAHSVNSTTFTANRAGGVTCSVYAKKPSSNGRNHVALGCQFTTITNAHGIVIFDLTNGQYVAQSGFSALTLTSYGSQDVGNGWYRFWMVVTEGGAGVDSFSFRPGPAISTATNSFGRASYLGNGTDGVLLWGAQVVTGTDPLPYSKTTTATNGIPRLMHNSSGSRLGLLVEGGATNLCLQSESLYTGWTTANIPASASNVITSPAGTVTADSMTDDSVNNRHYAYSNNVAFVSGTTYTMSVFAKAGTATAIQLVFTSTEFGTDEWATFDLANGVVGSKGSGVTGSDAIIQPVGNGWYRCVLTSPCISTGTTPGANIGLVNSNASATRLPNYVGSGQTAYLWGAQVEAQAFASSYIPTTTQSVTRAAETVHVPDSKITSWGDPGALVVHFYPPSQSGTLLSTDDAATAQVGIEANPVTDVRAFWSSGSTASETMTTGLQKAAHYWKGSASKFCLNGGPVRSGGNDLVIGNTDFVTLGAEATDSAGVPGTFSKYSDCIICKVEFYSGTLTDAQLQAITT